MTEYVFFVWKSFLRLFLEGGWVLYPIFFVSCMAWFIGIGKVLLYNRIRTCHKQVVNNLKKVKSIQFDPYQRLSLALASPSPVSRNRAYEGVLLAVSPLINKGLSTMSVCAIITPLLGLFGTISGMNEMFACISRFGFGSPSLMAHGISVALQATLTGLGAAVAIIFFHSYLLNCRSKLTDLLYADQQRLFSDNALPAGSGVDQKGSSMQTSDYRLIPSEDERPEINLAPFVDTIMILLIFFVVTANLYVETGIDVSKPKAASAKSIGAKSLLVGVTREGTIHIYGRQVSLDMLRMILEQEVLKQPDVTVVIIADRESSVGKAVEVMDQCNLAGVQKVSIAAGKGQ